MNEHSHHRPLTKIGILLMLIGRYLFAGFFIYGFWHKLTRGWLSSDITQRHFIKRLGELPIDSWQAAYLEYFAIPLAMPIGWIVTVGELLIGVSLVVGLMTRINAGFALFLLLNFAAGGYYNLSLPPFIIFAFVMMLLPTSHWLGMDKQLHNRFPHSIWFR